MGRVGLAAALLLAWAASAPWSPARADVEPDIYGPLLEQCIASKGADTDTLEACKGASARPCIDADGGTTMGVMMCYDREAEVWGRLMDRQLARLAASSPGAREALDASQQAWIAYSESECTYQVALWGEGSGARVQLAHCYAELTAERAIRLVRSEGSL